MATTLLQLSQTISTPLERGVTTILAHSGPNGEPSLIGQLPIMNIDGNSYSWTERQAYPGFGFAAINDAYQSGTSEYAQQSVALKTVGRDILVPRFLDQTSGTQVRATESTAQVEAIRAGLEKQIVKGVKATSPSEFDGLQSRLKGTFSTTNQTGQILDNVSGGAGGALSLQSLSRLIQKTKAQGSTGKILLMSEEMKLRLEAAAHATSIGGYLTFAPSEFGGEIMRYRGIPIVTVNEDENGDLIMPFTETSGDGNDTDCTSIYCIALGGSGFNLVQGRNEQAPGGYGLSVRDLGESQTKPELITRFDWYLNWKSENFRGTRRLRGVQDLAVTV